MIHGNHNRIGKKIRLPCGMISQKNVYLHFQCLTDFKRVELDVTREHYKSLTFSRLPSTDTRRQTVSHKLSQTAQDSYWADELIECSNLKHFDIDQCVTLCAYISIFSNF